MPVPHRRDFLAESLVLGGGLVATELFGRAVAPAEKIQVAVIGVRGQGNSLLRTFAAQKDVTITHICDLDENVRSQRAAELEKATGQKPKLIKDYKDLLEDKGVDVLVIGTPDHWHALPAIHGCIAKKDIYVEKPDGHNILEGKTMVAAARKYDRIMQLGTQARSSPYMNDAVEYVRAGNLGKVIFGRAWETSPQRPLPAVPDSDPPAGIDYETWLGPAPVRKFNRNRFHGNWRWFFDYGTGDLGNDGVHRMDYARRVMGLDWFDKVSCAGGKFFFDDSQEWPDTMQVTYEYSGKILVYEMRIWSKPKHHNLDEGAEVHGENGWVLLSNVGWKAFDAMGKMVKEGGDREALPRHVRNFLDAVRSRKREDLNQEIASGHISSVMCHAGNIAWRTGEKLKFDSKTETFDRATANQLITREYRKGFELPKV